MLKTLPFFIIALVMTTTALPFESLEDLFLDQHSMWVYFVFSFLAGLAVSFTPCIYPMIPITASILQSQQGTSHWRNFGLSLSYVLGIATIYSALGYVVAISGDYFGYWLSNPWFILTLFFFFMYLAGSMFGFYDLKMPRFLTRKRAEIKRGGSFVYTFLVGVVTGSVASPCVSPALIAILGFVAQSEQPIVGIFSLFFFTLGMSTLLLIVGTFSSFVSKMPRAGAWMLEINRALGFLILYIGVSFILPLIPDVFEPVLYGLITLAASAYYFFSDTVQHATAKLVKKIVGIILFFIGIIFILDPILCNYNMSLVQHLCTVASAIKG